MAKRGGVELLVMSCPEHTLCLVTAGLCISALPLLVLFPEKVCVGCTGAIQDITCIIEALATLDSWRHIVCILHMMGALLVP